MARSRGKTENSPAPRPEKFSVLESQLLLLAFTVVLVRAVAHRSLELVDRLAAVFDCFRLVPAEVVRRCLHVLNRVLELADRRGDARMLGGFGGGGLLSERARRERQSAK